MMQNFGHAGKHIDSLKSISVFHGQAKRHVI